MKFTYENKPDDSECVAYIADTGNLIVKNTDTGDFTIAMCKAGYCHNEAGADLSTATHKFYKGDKLEIEF